MNAKTKKTITISARVSDDVDNKLSSLAFRRNKTKSEIIAESIERYYDEDKEESEEVDSYTKGLPYFGKYSLGAGDLSVTYKQRIKEILREKFADHFD